MNTASITLHIKTKAKELGFLDCRIAKSKRLDKEALQLESWLNQGKNGTMHYMANHFEKRVDPGQLVEGSKSIISLSYNYYQLQKQERTAPKIAMYALGEDYHNVVKERAELLLGYIRSIAGDVTGRCFVDSAPVLEKVWAQKSGIGWIGKNSNVLSKRIGSYFFLAEIICDLELDYDSPVKDFCGTCTKCIDACPTGAIDQPYSVNGSKCISYFTIENRDAELPDEMKGKFENWMFGCDICQQVCPINSQSETHSERRFEPPSEILEMNAADWEKLSEETFNRIFKLSAVKRTKYKGLLRNIKFLKPD